MAVAATQHQCDPIGHPFANHVEKLPVQVRATPSPAPGILIELIKSVPVIFLKVGPRNDFDVDVRLPGRPPFTADRLPFPRRQGRQKVIKIFVTVVDPVTMTGPAEIERVWLALGETVEPFECEVY